jgi:hypothetical protein
VYRSMPPGNAGRLSAPVCRLPETPVTATYGASVTTMIRPWLLPVIAFVVLMGFAWIVVLAINEEICFDRRPWWGPPENPNVDGTGSGAWVHLAGIRRRTCCASW